MTATGLAAGLALGPRAMERPRDAGWTATGTLAGQAQARVDQAGLVSPEGAGWSLDWWIGADDRWYLPAREATVRQQRLGVGPVIETAVRIPGGDARHRAFAVLAGSVPVTVVEVENDSPVPVALALALRPYGVGVGVGHDTAGGGGRGDGGAGFGRSPLRLDGWPSPVGAAHHEPVAVRSGGTVLVVLPRPPAHAGAAADTDLLAVVEAGADPVWSNEAGGPSANAVLLFPLPHRTTLRILLPATAGSGTRPGVVGAGVVATLRRLAGRRPTRLARSASDAAGSGRSGSGDAGEAGPLPDPRAVPTAEEVARGWSSVLDTGARITVPDSGLGALADGARGRLLLATADLGRRLAHLGSGAGAELAALALTGHQREVDTAVAPLLDDRPAGPPATPAVGADVLAALGLARSLAGAVAAAGVGPRQPASPLLDGDRLGRLVEWALPVLALVERAGDAAATARARAGVALLAAPVDPAGAADLAASVDEPGGPPAAGPAAGDVPAGGDPPAGRAPALVLGPAATLDRVNELAAQASPAGAWGGAVGDDPAGAARFVAALRSLLVDDSGPGLDLLPGFPSSWRGGAVEVHALPTRHGSLSFAIRWHGYRPALLWELEPVTTPGAPTSGPPAPATGAVAPIRLRASGLDAAWSTTHARGEALLTGSGDELPAAPAPGEGFQ